jgi:hypothetical protein
MGMAEEGTRAYMAQLEDAVRTWWRASRPTDNLPRQSGQLVDPTGPATGQRYPLNNFLRSQVQLLWALKRVTRVFGAGTDRSAATQTWMKSKKDKLFAGLHNRARLASNNKGDFARYVTLYSPVDASPQPTLRGTHLSFEEDLSLLPALPHLQPGEMRKMESVLRSYLQGKAREPYGTERFRGPPFYGQLLQALQAAELAGRVFRWEKTEPSQGKDRAQVERALQMGAERWQAAFTDMVWTHPSPAPTL